MKIKGFALWAAGAALGLGGTFLSAATVDCPPDTSFGPSFITLTYDAPVTASCYDFGQSTEPGNGQYTVEFTDDPVTLDNNILELPTNTQAFTPISNFMSGTFDDGKSGTFNFLVGSASDLFLVFKLGGGNTDPYWFAFQLAGVAIGTEISWVLNGGTGALSNTAACSAATSRCHCRRPSGCSAPACSACSASRAAARLRWLRNEHSSLDSTDSRGPRSGDRRPRFNSTVLLDGRIRSNRVVGALDLDADGRPAARTRRSHDRLTSNHRRPQSQRIARIHWPAACPSCSSTAPMSDPRRAVRRRRAASIESTPLLSSKCLSSSNSDRSTSDRFLRGAASPSFGADPGSDSQSSSLESGSDTAIYSLRVPPRGSRHTRPA